MKIILLLLCVVQSAWAAQATSDVTLSPKKALSKIVLAPNASPVPPIRFQLEKKGTSVVLYYTETSPEFRIAREKPLMIHLITESAIDIDPDLITWENFPKGSKEITLKTKGIKQGSKVVIRGKASFTGCNNKLKSCSKTLLPVIATLQY